MYATAAQDHLVNYSPVNVTDVIFGEVLNGDGPGARLTQPGTVQERHTQTLRGAGSGTRLSDGFFGIRTTNCDFAVAELRSRGCSIQEITITLL